MGWFSRGSRSTGSAGRDELPLTPHRFAVVDVETSGLYANSSRVLSVAALALDERGRPERQVVTLVNPGCDPGPVHIHGLTRQRLAGSPRYADVLPQLHDLLAGRVLVAHNASFDHGFLAAEAVRAGATLPTRQRLCTLALSRRLGLDVPNHQLATVAAHWRIPQRRAHDAHDDALVTAQILMHSVQLAARLGMPLPLVDCSGHNGSRPHPARIVRTPCPWHNPGRLEPGRPLVQGMKVVITGETRMPREELCARLTEAGLEVLSAVSRLTALLVANDPRPDTAKVLRARAEDTLVVDERTLLRLLRDVRPGQPRGAAPAPAGPFPVPGQRVARPAAGPLAGCRVLVLGGTHEQAAAVRADVVAAGAAAAVNLSANVTDLFLLDGADGDPRLARALNTGVRVHRGPVALGIALPTSGTTASGGANGVASDPPAAAPTPSVEEPGGEDSVVLSRGAVIDLPQGAVWTVNAAWRADALADGCDLDVVAFLLDDGEQVTSDEDLVFWNAPVSEDGAVALSIDGDSEQAVRVDLGLLPENCTRVVIAAALSGGTTFGQLGAVALSVDGDQAAAATATLDAGTTETVLVLAELYRRGDRWRVRAVGQGYDDGLGALARRYGVNVDL